MEEEQILRRTKNVKRNTPVSVLVILAIDKNGEMCKYYRAQEYPSLGAVLAPGLVTKGEKEVYECIRIMRLTAQ